MLKLCDLLRTTVKTSKSLVPKHSRKMHCRKIVFNEFGDPAKVAKLVEHTLPDKLDDGQVL